MNKHIRFDDDEDNDTDITKSNHTVMDIDKKDDQIDSSNKIILTLILRKDMKSQENSFGFQLMGNKNEEGNHYVSHVEPNSPSSRADLNPLDKIIKVNGFDVRNFTINALFDYLEYEMSLNEYKLVLVVERKPSTAKRSSCDAVDEKCNLNHGNNLNKKNKVKSSNLKSSIEKNELENNNQIPLLEGLMPAVELERMFNSNLTESINQTSHSKTLELNRNEKIDEIKFLVQERPFKKFNVPSKFTLNLKAKEIQIKLSEQSKYVNWKEIIYELLQHYECQHIGQLDLKQADQLETISTLIRLQKKIDTFIISYDSRVSCVCLTDLEDAICHDYNYAISKQNCSNVNSINTIQNDQMKVNKFQDIHIGPLIKNQIVRQLFKIADNVTSIRQLKPIKLIDVMKNLHSFLEENSFWSKKVKDNEFEKYLVERYKVNTINDLCVKINNIGLLVGTIKSVQHIYSNSLKNVRLTLASELEQLISNEKTFLLKNLGDKLQFYKREINNSESGENYEYEQLNSRLNYLKMDSINVITDLLQIFEKLFDKTDFEQISNFLYFLKSNKFMADAFQIAISFAKSNYYLELIEMKFEENYDDTDDKYTFFLKKIFLVIFNWRFKQYENRHNKLSRDVRKFFDKIFYKNGIQLQTVISKKYFIEDNEHQENVNEDNNNNNNNNNNKYEIKQLEQEDLNEKLANFVKNKLEPNSFLGFEHLIKIENDLFGKCYFTELLFKNKHLFESQNLSITLIGNENINHSVMNKIEIKDLVRYIKQIKSTLKKMNLEENLLNAKLNEMICSYYSIESINQLGYGDSLITLIDQDQEIANHAINIVYQDSAFHSIEINKGITQIEYNYSTTNGEKRDKIIDLLNKCPLLENIYDYLNWKEDYKKTFGKLRDFLNNLNEMSLISNQTPLIDLLELDPGDKNLYKLTRQTDISNLKFSIENGDFLNAAGHLVSLISLKYGTLLQTPRSLIINEMQSSLSIYFDKCKNLSNNDNEYFDYSNTSTRLNRQFCSFLVEFICKIPFKLLVQIIFNYIIDPLINIEGNHNVKRDIFFYSILNSYLNNQNYFHFNRENAYIIDERIKYLIKLGKACSIPEWSTENYNNILNSLLLDKLNSITDNKKKIKNESTKEITKIEIKNETKDLVPKIHYKQEEAKSLLKQTLISIKNDFKNQFEHIESIRKRYGIGIELDDQIKSVTESLKGVIGRSLESLSNELYNKEMHFVLELIQNADDNNYINDSDEIEPTLVFILENDHITLLNNEIGFSEQNINAICDVKASTKGKHQRGYIGRKGIGFKSVFTITDSPEIHSNGYHINFDLKNGHIGYILPNWISNNNKLDEIESLKKFASNLVSKKSEDLLNKIGNFNTIIRLPFNSESAMSRHKSAVIINNFNDIKPYLLLFLNRLRNLIIIDNVDNNSKNEIIYHRNDINENLVEINSNQTNEISQKWLVVKEVIKIPSNLKPSEEVESTDLCLAYPLQNLDTFNSLPKMDVFAYLPLRSFGFTFIIQADFVIPASRQDINQDNEWNQYICKHISSLFIKSLEYFNSHSIFNGNKLDSLRAYLRFLPLEEEIVGLFNHIPGEIIEKLRNESFLPVESDQIDGEILWKKPFECVIVNNDEFIRQVLSSDLLKKYLGRYYLHLSMVNSNEINQQLLYRLGVRNLNLNDLLEILKNVFSRNDFGDLKSTAKWLVVLEHCLNNYSLNKEEKFIKQLNEFEFIPVFIKGSSSRKMVSLSKENVFFPLSKVTSSIVNLIEKELTILDTESLLCLDDVKNAQILNFLKNLGIKQIEPNEIIDLLLKNNIFENSNEESLILYTIYLHDIFYSNNSNSFSHLTFNLPKLKENLLLKTNRGFKKIFDEKEEIIIYLSKAYGNKYDLETMFPSYDWTLIDPIYHTKSLEFYANSSNNFEQSNKLMLSWRKFFITIGLNDIFFPKLKQTAIKANELDNFDNYKQYSSLLNVIRGDESYLFNDYDCPIFDHYISITEKTDSTILIKELTNLYRLIEENWDNKLSNFKYVSVGVISNKNEPYTSNNFNKQSIITIKDSLCETNYFRNLRTKSWICAEVNQFIDISCISNLNKFELKTITKLEKPANTFIKEQVFLRYYGLHVPYTMNCPYKDKSNFGRDINLKYEFNLMDFLTTFKEWISSSKKFYASFLQMRNIYYLISNQLNSYESKKDINLLCKSLILPDKPLIFVPIANYDDINNSKEKIVPGFFVPLKEVFWSDPTHIFEIYKENNKKLSERPILLEAFYYDKIKGEQTKQIFLNDFNVKNSPTLLDYIDLLEHIALQASVKKSSENEELIRHVFMLYETLVEKCIEREQAGVQNTNIIISDAVKNEFTNLIKYKQIIPCLNNKWLSLEDKDTKQRNHPILVDNDFDLAEKFSDKISIVMIPRNSCVSSSNDSFYSNDSFKNLCDADNLNQNLRYFFYELLELKSFKQIVILELENITESLREAPQVQNLCRAILPYIQYFLYYRLEWKSSYKNFENINEKLEKMRFYSVKELQNIYKCLHDPKVQVIVSNKTCIDISDKSKNWVYYVRSDILENRIEIIKGFAKFFLKLVPSLSNEKNEKELVKFCLFINQFNNFEISEEDKYEIENDYNLKLVLPENEEEWKIPESVQFFKRSLQDTNEIYNNNNMISMKSINPVNYHLEDFNKKSKRQKLIELEKISQNQINDPNFVEDNKRNLQTEFSGTKFVEEKNLKTLNERMHELAHKMSTNFDIQSLNEKNILIEASVREESYNVKEMPQVVISNLNVLAQQINNSKSLSIDQEIINSDFRSKIGRWGELWVFEMLKLKFKIELDTNMLKIEWMNEQNESGLPYDFRVTQFGNSLEIINIQYIEVKSTTKSCQEIFPVSLQELLFAQEFSNQFEIYRLYNAGSNEPNNAKLKIIKNVPSLLNSHGANLYMVI